MAVTKQQLQQQVEVLRAECDRLRTENAALRNRSHSAPTKQHPSDPTWEARKAAMEAARAEAIRTGRTVKVQF